MSNMDEMSAKELKALITEHGLTFTDCVEKPDLQARAREAQKKAEADCPQNLSRSSHSKSNVAEMSAKELKALITEHGLKFTDCVEKPDLQARAREAQKKAEAVNLEIEPRAVCQKEVQRAGRDL